jgi:hypothetical protein
MEPGTSAPNAAGTGPAIDDLRMRSVKDCSLESLQRVAADVAVEVARARQPFVRGERRRNRHDNISTFVEVLLRCRRAG